MVTILAAVFHHAAPGATGLDGLPQVCKGGLGHVRVTDDVLALADQFFPAEAGNLDEGIVGVGDDTFEIGFGNDGAAGEGRFVTSDRQIDFHGAGMGSS